MDEPHPVGGLLVRGGLAVVARLEGAVVVGVVATALEDGVEIRLWIDGGGHLGLRCMYDGAKKSGLQSIISMMKSRIDINIV